MKEEQFERLINLIGIEGIQKLHNSHVAVFGIGGVGGYIVESLARFGVGNITLIDNDTVSLSNLNRQIVALHSTIGKYKTEVMKNRVLDIYPNCKVNTINTFFDNTTYKNISFEKFDYVADAIDSVKSKLLLIQICKENNIPIISCMGTGNKLDPTKLQITDISKTVQCPLAKTIRTELKKMGITNLKVLFSTEQIKKANISENNKVVPSSIISVPATARFNYCKPNYTRYIGNVTILLTLYLFIYKTYTYSKRASIGFIISIHSIMLHETLLVPLKNRRIQGKQIFLTY